MIIQNIQERTLVAGGLFVLAVSLGALGVVLAAMALDHMAIAASLCGPVAGHCVLCVAAVAALIASLMAGTIGASLFQPIRPIKARR